MGTPSWIRLAVGFIAAALLCVGAASVRAQGVDSPRLLVAKPALAGLYGETALLAVPLRGTHFGFILNRATQLRMGTLFPSHEPSAKVLDPVYFGGPVMVEAIFAVVRRNPGAGALHLFGELYATANANAVDEVIEQTPNDARYFAGFVAWQPGELAAEIDAGYWYVAEPQADLLFTHDPAAMWPELVKRFGTAGPALRAAFSPAR